MKKKNAAILFLTAAIWGVAFVAQTVGMDHLGPFSFNGLRSMIGCLVLVIYLIGRERIAGKKYGYHQENEQNDPKALIIGGILCGLCLFTATSLQQIGIQYTTAGKSGFVTAFYIVLVPLLGIFIGKKIGWKIWTAVVLALAGLYFLCITDGFSIGKGEGYTFLCALVFSLHILVIDHFAPKTDGVKMSCIQFLLVGILSIPFILLKETLSVEAIRLSLVPLLYAGVLSSGVAYTLQIIGQKGVNPAIASLILSLESSISVIAGWLILGQHLSTREGVGCLIMLAAIVLAQIPDKKPEIV